MSNGITVLQCHRCAATASAEVRADATVDLYDWRNDPEAGDKLWACEVEPDDEAHTYRSLAPTAPLAICRATLKRAAGDTSHREGA